MIKDTKKPWVPKTYVKCKLCNTEIFSWYEGEFHTCRCGAISIDETEYYCRFIGDPQNFIFPQKENIEC